MPDIEVSGLSSSDTAKNITYKMMMMMMKMGDGQWAYLASIVKNPLHKER